MAGVPVEVRPFVPDDADAVLRLAAARYTPDARWHVGDLAWHLALTGGVGLGDHTDVWIDAGRLTAVSWWDAVEDEMAVALTFVGPTELLPAIVAHASAAADLPTDVVLNDSEQDVLEVLTDLGFVPVDHDQFFVDLQRPLTRAATDPGLEPQLPPGFRMVTSDQCDPAHRVALHRLVWNGSALTVEGYEAMTRRWPYNPEFDQVVVAPDGSLVASTTGWLAPGGTTGQLEPVGTLPPFRRRGLSRALGRSVLRAFAAVGAERALVYARGDDAYPVPRAVYGDLGFTVHARQQRLRLAR